MNDFQLTNPENPDLCDPSKSQWYTPPELAERIVQWALSGYEDVRGPHGMLEMGVLEPSAGRGALLRYIAAEVTDFHCFEIDPKNIPALREFTFRAENVDFLRREPSRQYDLVIMNPPFEDGATEEHVLHALKFAPRVVCHCPLTTLAGQGRRTGLWAIAYLKRLVIHASRRKYSSNQRGGMTDMCTIDVVHRPEWLSVMKNPDYVAASGVDLEWWA